MSSSNQNEWFVERIEGIKTTIFRIAYVILRNEKDCEDAASNAILKAYENLNSLKNKDRFRAWFFTILKNECYKTSTQRNQMMGFDNIDEIGYEQIIEDTDLHNALAELKEDYRIAITLYYLEGYSIAEIADILETPVGTMKNRLSRARDMLRAKLKESEDFIE